jgi:H+-transporting ATPase
MSTATVTAPDGSTLVVAKGAYAVIADLARDSAEAQTARELESGGFRVLAVSVGPAGAMRLAGLVALSDPPRPDSRALVERLAALGVRTVMVTGDAAGTAQVIAREVGIDGSLSQTAAVGDSDDLEGIGVFAGVLPEDKFALVKALQGRGHIVAVCGDGVNDAPALRQAQMGVAVLTATDVAKSAAGVVLTRPGLGGIVATIEEGRSTFQRILTYTLRSVVQKVVQVLFLLAGLIISGHPILTPVLMVLMMVAGDFLAMSSSTDNVRPSSRPNVWRIGNLTRASVVLGLCDLAFCVASLVAGRFLLHFGASTLPTLAVVTLVFSGQAVFYVSRERHHFWASRPSRWMVISSIIDLGLIATLASWGVLMAPIPFSVIAGIAIAAVGLAFLLDFAKVALFRKLAIA